MQELIQKWHKHANNLSAEAEHIERGRYYSALEQEEKNECNRCRDMASAYRDCANQLEKELNGTKRLAP